MPLIENYYCIQMIETPFADTVFRHRVDRVPGYISRSNWLLPLIHKQVLSPLCFRGGGGGGRGTQSLAEEEARGANSDEGTDALVL
jgi:hypothetical protein